MVGQTKYTPLIEQVHAYIQQATRDIVPPAHRGVALVRKKMSVFTFGICQAVAVRASADCEELYYQCLLKGGLERHAARVVVERTCLEFMRKEYGEPCFNAGKQFVIN